MNMKDFIAEFPLMPEMMDETDATMEVVVQIGHSKIKIKSVYFDYDNMRIVIETE